MPTASSRASTKASIGVRRRSAWRTPGNLGRTGFSSDHQSRPARSLVVWSKALSTRSLGQAAPVAIQASSLARSAAATGLPLPSGGISPARIRSIA